MQSYCAACGEKRPDRDDWKLQTIAGETFSELTNLEQSKLLQTLKLLVFTPGALTRDYWSGRRKAYLGPVKLYLIFFALSLLLYSIHQPTAVYDVQTMAEMGTGGQLARVLDRVAAERGLPAAVVAEEMSSRWQSYISMSQLAYPLIIALTLKLLFVRRQQFFAEHLIFALHVLAFVFLSSVVMWPFYFFFGPSARAAGSPFTPVYFALTATSAAWTIAYVLLALRRAYGDRWMPAAARSVAVFVVYFVTATALTVAALALAISHARTAG